MEAAAGACRAARSWATRTGQALIALCKKEDVSKIELSMMIENFRKKLSNLDDKQAEFELFLKDEDLEKDIESAAEYDTQSMQALVVAKTKLESLTMTKDDAASAHSSSSSSALESKLPKLTLPTFDGNILEWLPFWEIFTDAVDAKDMSTSAKFQYLQGLLKGEAKTAIAGLSLSGESYDTACAILKERYGRKEKLIFVHVQELLAVSVPSQPSVPDLWEVYNKLQSHVRSLECLDITGDRYGVILTPLVVSKLPQSLRMEWAKEAESKDTAAVADKDEDGAAAVMAADGEAVTGGSSSAGQVWRSTPADADLGFLMRFLLREIKRIDRSQTYEGRPDATTSSSSPPSAAALFASSDKNECGVCNKSHPTVKCFMVKNLSMAERKEKLKANSTCWKCLVKSTKKTPHPFRRCTAKCSKCSGPHHSLICPHSASHAVSKPGPKPHTNSDSKSHTDSSFVMSSSSSSHSSVATDSNVLLQTLKVTVKGQRRAVKATVLFDTGSDRTYISQDLVNKIQPEWIES